MTHDASSADTEAVLLLCGRFGGERQEPFQPLSIREYAELARWLNAQELRPADLLATGGQALVRKLVEARLEPGRIEFLLGRGTALALALERWARGGIWVLARSDPGFPRRLMRLFQHAAPPLLYGVGDKELLDGGGVAIVGSRDASEAALEFTRGIAGKCAQEGMPVISGGARGVDAAAMQGATEAGGRCVGVLANDLLKVSLNRQNRKDLQEGRLALVSPFYPEAGFHAGNAMARNRYIYSLADQAVVIDSALGSGGTWEGAVENLQHGWVPLFVRTPGEGEGNSELVRRGGVAFSVQLSEGTTLAEVFATAEKSAALVAGESPGEQQMALTPADSEKDGDAEAPVVVRPDTAPVLPSTDMYPDFVARLTDVLAAEPLSEKQIAVSLGLEKSQAAAWLNRALEAGMVQKTRKPVRFTLARQGTLC